MSGLNPSAASQVAITNLQTGLSQLQVAQAQALANQALLVSLLQKFFKAPSVFRSGNLFFDTIQKYTIPQDRVGRMLNFNYSISNIGVIDILDADEVNICWFGGSPSQGGDELFFFVSLSSESPQSQNRSCSQFFVPDFVSSSSVVSDPDASGVNLGMVQRVYNIKCAGYRSLHFCGAYCSLSNSSQSGLNDLYSIYSGTNSTQAPLTYHLVK
jgi:hypothetical protein